MKGSTPNWLSEISSRVGVGVEMRGLYRRYLQLWGGVSPKVVVFPGGKRL